MSSNYVSSLISLTRNVNSARKGDKVAVIKTVGEACKFVKKAAKVSDTPWGQYANSIYDGFTKAAEGSPVLSTVAKGLKIAQKGDMISMANSAVKAFKSDNPARIIIEDGLGFVGKFTSKFLVLNYAKNLCNIKGIKPIADKVTDFSKNTKGFGQLNNIIAGCTYSFCTINGSKLGKKAGKWICDKIGLPPREEKVHLNGEEETKPRLVLR